MYNAEVKKSFLNTIVNENSYKTYVTVFNKIEEMESTFGKDICEMSVDEIMVVLDLNTGTRFTNGIQMISILKNYVDWCIQNGKIVGENNFEKIDYKEIDQSMSMKTSYLKDEQEFEDICAVIFKKDAYYCEGVQIPRELALRLCFYAEMDTKEIVLIKKEQVDFENKVILSPVYLGIKYPVDDKILKLCRFCIDMKVVENQRGFDEPVCDNKYLFRSRRCSLRYGKTEDTPMNSMFITRLITQLSRDYYESTDMYKEITQKKLADSHKFIRIHNSGNPEMYIKTVIKDEIIARKPDINKKSLNNQIFKLEKLYKSWVKALF